MADRRPLGEQLTEQVGMPTVPKHKQLFKCASCETFFKLTAQCKFCGRCSACCRKYWIAQIQIDHNPGGVKPLNGDGDAD